MIGWLLLATIGAAEPPSPATSKVPEIQFVIVAKTRKITFSGYQFDGCKNGQLVKPGGDSGTHTDKTDCLPVGGFVYDARLADVEQMDAPPGFQIKRVGFIDYGSLNLHTAKGR
ncbi:MAG: hypothetical protein ACREO3_10655, partial [Arenimonas sp.]